MAPKELLIVSLDVHKNTHYVHCECKNTGEYIAKDFSFPNSAPGFQRFFTEIQTRLKQNKISALAVVLEPTGPYWKPLAYAAVARDWPLYLVSTEQVYHQRIADDPGASKIDTLDPRTIAKLFRDGKAFPARLLQGVFLQMRRLHREYMDLTKKLAREKIQIRCLLSEVNPEFTSFFANPFGKIAMAVLNTAPTPQMIHALGIDKLTAIFKSHGNGIIGRRKALKLLTLMESSIAVPDKTTVPLLKRTVERVYVYQEQINNVADSLTLLAKPWIAKLTSIEGIDQRPAARFIAELGDISVFKSPKSLVSMAGIAPKAWASGTSVKKKTRISKKGNPYLRTIIYFMALSCIRKNTPLKAYYNHLLAKDKPKMVAIIAIARKLLHVIYHVLNNQPYMPEKIGSGSK